MNAVIDVVGLLFIAVNIALGVRYGLLRRVFAFGGLFAGIGLATAIGNPIARFFHGGGSPSALYADAWSFIAIALFVTAAVELLGALYNDRITSVASLMFDRTTAVAAGAVLGVLEIAICCVTGLAVGRAPTSQLAPAPSDRTSVSDSVRSSIIGGRVNTIEGAVTGLFAPVLTRNIPDHLAESDAS
jgi:hypothetical protein